MEPDIEDLRRTYSRMSNDQLVRLATREAAGLREEAVCVIEEELVKRGLAEGAMQAVAAQRRQYTRVELDVYCGMIRHLPCPECASSAMPLNAVLVGKCMSFIVLSQYNKELKVACPDCLRKALSNANTMTALLGWWGIPWGLVYSIKALSWNSKMEAQAKSEQPSDLMLAFTLEHVGTIEANKSDDTRLRALVKDRS